MARFLRALSTLRIDWSTPDANAPLGAPDQLRHSFARLLDSTRLLHRLDVPRLYAHYPEGRGEPSWDGPPEALQDRGRGGTRVKVAAAIGPDTGGFLTIDGGGMVVTPWDLVM